MGQRIQLPGALRETNIVRYIAPAIAGCMRCGEAVVCNDRAGRADQSIVGSCRACVSHMIGFHDAKRRVVGGPDGSA